MHLERTKLFEIRPDFNWYLQESKAHFECLDHLYTYLNIQLENLRISEIYLIKSCLHQ